jgi:hypothetical protein
VFPCSQLDNRQYNGVETVAIQQRAGELSCFYHS